MRNKRIRKVLTAYLFAFVVLFSGSIAFAKSETVYFLLDRHGTPFKTIVVNSFTGSNRDVIDYGEYEEIRNLSSSAKPMVEGDKIVFKSEGNDSVFYYRGELKNAVMPWNIEIKYYLDGKEIDPEELTHSKGNFEMHIKVPTDGKNAYADRYTVQMQGVFLNGISELSVENATIVAIGSQYTVASIFIPGQEHFVRVKAKIDGLEMGAFTFTGVRASLDSDFDFKEIETRVDTLVNASAMVLAGMVKSESGANALKEGISGVDGGLNLLIANHTLLTEGNTAVLSGLKGLSEASGSLPAGVRELLEATLAFQMKLSPLKDIATSMLAAPDPGIAAMAQAVSAQIQFNEGIAEGLKKLISAQEEISAGTGAIYANYAAFHEAFETYLGGVTRIGDAADRLAFGANEFTNGFEELIEGQKSFVAGVGDAQIKLKEALLFIDGTAKGNPGSFVSKKNKTETVTFVMRIPELRKAPEVREPLPPLPKKSLLGKFMDLFGIEWE